MDAATIYRLVAAHRVTHYCGAPVVHNLLIDAPAELRATLDHELHAMIAAAPPPARTIEGAEQLGIDLTHVYGLTEVYGPAAVCAKHEAWADLDAPTRARLNGRQGVRYLLQDRMTVIDPATGAEVPPDGDTVGEIVFRGNITMMGYFKNPAATQEAFAHGWFHSGDLAVREPDGYVKIKDRAKDVIISGGENISSVEVEDALYRHPAVAFAGVVAQPDEKWGETPCAYVELRPGATATEAELIDHCRTLLPGFKVPRAVVFTEMPEDLDGKDPEARAARAVPLGGGLRVGARRRRDGPARGGDGRTGGGAATEGARPAAAGVVDAPRTRSSGGRPPTASSGSRSTAATATTRCRVP